MDEKRNCIGHDVNELTREGDSVIGTVYAGMSVSAAISVMMATIPMSAHRVRVLAVREQAAVDCW
jgi:orotate phosphoribosyltransferase